MTYFIIVVTWVITFRVKYFFIKASSCLNYPLISYSMLQKIRITVVLQLTQFSIEAFPSFLKREKLDYLVLKKNTKV